MFHRCGRVGRSVLYILPVCAAFFVGAAGIALRAALDWTLVEIALVCLMPGLAVIDLLVMCISFWCARSRGRDLPAERARILQNQEKEFCRRWLAPLAGLHIATAALAAFLLAVPSSHILFTGGITFPRLRAVLLALAALGVLYSLPLPWHCARVLGDNLQDASFKDI